MIKVALSGINGRMGQMLLKAVLAAPDMELSAALGHSGSSAIGKDAGVPSGITTGVTVTDDIESLRDCDVLIDFSRPEATLTYLPVCAASGTAVVIGTTGFTAEEKKTLEAASESVPVLLAPNTSLGVNAVFKLIEEAARLLSDVDVEIFEMHHRNKVDAPSGTALEMGRRVAQGPESRRSCRSFPRRTHGTPKEWDNWFCSIARRRCRRQAHGDLRRHWRAG